LLLATTATAQHSFIKPDPALKPLTVENIVFSQGSYSIGPCIDTRTRAEKIAAGCLVEMGNGVEWHCAVGHGCVVVGDQLGLQDSILTPSGASLPAKKFDRSFWLASSLFAAASTADIITTHKALERGAVELNPFFADQNGAGLRTSANVIATTGIWAIAAYCEKRGHRRFGRILLLTGAAIRTAAAFWNHNRRR
jgi:hypothetical protein